MVKIYTPDISFDKTKQKYVVTFYEKGKYKKRSTRISYSIGGHGPFAKPLAIYTANTGKKLRHWYVTDGIYTSIFVYSKQYGLKRVLIDAKYTGIIKNHKLTIVKNKTGQNLYYATIKINKRNIPLHRFINTLYSYNQNPVDHINHDGLDNRKINLRIVTYSVNNRNQRLRSDNSTGIQGVHINDKWTYVAEIRDYEGNKIRKRFAIRKYGGKENALAEAEKWRNKMVEKYYDRQSAAKPLYEERSTTIESDHIFLDEDW